MRHARRRTCSRPRRSDLDPAGIRHQRCGIGGHHYASTSRAGPRGGIPASLVSHIDGKSAPGVERRGIGRHSDEIDSLAASLNGEAGSGVGAIVLDADLVAALVAAHPGSSSKQLMRPLGVDVEMAVGKKVGPPQCGRGVVGVGQAIGIPEPPNSRGNHCG